MTTVNQRKNTDNTAGPAVKAVTRAPHGCLRTRGRPAGPGLVLLGSTESVPYGASSYLKLTVAAQDAPFMNNIHLCP
ncbi:hypothetical protein PAMP_001984 [Pampus punctatissimus]